MSNPSFAKFDPQGQLTFGFVGEGVTTPVVNGLGVLTNGFVWGEIWFSCTPIVSTTWSSCIVGVTTIWEACDI